MKAGWETKKLGEVCRFVRGPFGGSLKKEIFVSEGYAVYEQQHAIYDQFDEIRYFITEHKFDEMKRFELRPNDLIMSCSGTIGKVAIVPDGINKGIINQALLKLSPLDSILPQFLKYWMASNRFQESLLAQVGGAAIQNVASVAVLKEIRVTFPPLPEQQRIVAILDEAFDGIAAAKANAEKNLQNARELFERCLSDLFLHAYLRSKQKLLEEVATIIGGGTPPKDVYEYYEGNIPWATVRDMKSDFIRDTEFKITPKAIKESSTNLIGVGNVVIATRVGLGKVCITGQDTAINQDLKAVIPTHKDQLSVKFLFWWFKSISKIIQSEGVGATVKGVKLPFIKSLLIPVPTLSEQQRIADQLDALSEETQRLESIYQQKLAALDELKKSLLDQAFSGNLTSDVMVAL